MTTKIDNAFKNVYAAKTAQSVWNDIKELQRFPSRRTRWIWELLQNAIDASPSVDNPLIAEIKYRPGKLIFSHNGRSFKAAEVAHLIASGSTKYEDEEAIGEFGSGFLTTHLLSLEIEVLGQLDDGQEFAFLLARNMESRDALEDSMKQAEDDFKNSLNRPTPPIPGPFTTQFIYPIKDDAVNAVKAGIETLEQCAPYVVAFNKKFDHINIDVDIKECRKTFSFKAITPPELNSPIQQITVKEYKNDNLKEREYLLAQGKEGTSVIVPLESNSSRWECLPPKNISRLFKAFPLIGTESFSFPAVINNSSDFFTPTEARDDIPLGESNDKANTQNRAVIKEACKLLVNLLKYASSKYWHHVHLWAEIPVIQHKDEKTREWLRTHVKEKLIEEIRQTPVVLNEVSNVMTPKDACLPLAEDDEGISDIGVETLWDLLDDWQEYHEKLPRRSEAIGWCQTIRSWAKIYKNKPVPSFSEVMDGEKLVSHIEEKTRKDGNEYGSLTDLQNLLQDNLSAIEWLNRLHHFFNERGLREAVRESYIVADQDGSLDKLSALYRDQDIDEELKEIAELLDWRDSQNNWKLRQLLRDKRLTSLAEEIGAGNKDNGEVLGDLIEKLKERAEDNDNIDDNFKKVSVRLFAWIVNQKDWSSLHGFPVFAKDSKSDSPIFDLPTARAGEPPLAPIRSWPEDLQQFSAIFPPDRILDDSFFEALPSPDTWKMLDEEKKLIKWNMITCRDEVDLKVLSPDPEVYEDNKTEHKATHPICVTDVVELEKVLKEVVYDSRERGYKFWRFLTEWLVNKDIQGLEIVSEGASCKCGQTHEYYPAAWVMLVRKVNWIRDGTPRHFPEAEHLAKLLQEKGWELSSLNENPGTEKLLKAMNVDQATLKRLFIPDTVINTAVILSENPQLVRHMEDNEKRHQIEQILDTVGEDLPLVSEAVHDEKFLEEYKKKKKQDLTIQANKSLGLLVEKIVGEILNKEGFNVKSHDRGWDFDMTGHITELKVVQNSSSNTWRVEVKTTRTEDNHQGVYMSSAQAEEAVKYGKQYLLCVIPLGQEDAIPENIREKMLFIKNIGNSVAPLCADLDRLKEVRDDITADTSSDLELIVEEGKPRVLVKKPIWDKVGFPLTDLLERLK